MASLRHVTIRGGSGADIKARQNGVLVGVMDGVVITDCNIEGVNGWGIRVGSNNRSTHIDTNRMIACGGAWGDRTSPENRAAIKDEGYGTVISGNSLVDNEVSNMYLDGAYASVTGNTLTDGAYGDGDYFIYDRSNSAAITGNTIYNGGGFYYGHSSTSGSGSCVTGNVCAANTDYLGGSVYLDGVTNLVFTGNFVGRIAVQNSLALLIANNVLWSEPGGATATVRIMGTTRNSAFTGNKLRRASNSVGGTSGKIANAVWLQDGTTDNWIAHNDFFDTWTDAAVLDEGTNTVEGNRE